MLIAVLFTAGVGLLLVGAQTGSADEVSKLLSAKVSQVSELPLEVEAQIEQQAGAGLTQKTIFHPIFEAGRLPQIHHTDGVWVKGHKHLYKRFRSRSGSDLFYSAFAVDYYHPRMVRLPEVYRASIHAAILVTSSLRGPPTA